MANRRNTGERLGFAGGLFLIVAFMRWDLCIAAGSQLIVEKSESWGPCPTPESICRQTTLLFESGMVVVKGKEETRGTLGPEAVKRVIEFIRTSRLLEKDCTADPNSVADYGATFRLHLDGRDRTIAFPDCEGDLNTLGELMEAPPASAPKTVVVPR